MAGIYLHIPFCRQKCAYCNFFSSASHKLKEPFISALMSELSQNHDYLSGETVSTIYFGGGTPSILSAGEIRSVLEAVRTTFPVAGDAEITLEANPDDFSGDYISSLVSIGINRLSIGIQSFHDEDLQLLGRSHRAEQGKNVIRQIQGKPGHPGMQKPGLSIDLIYGIPGLTDSRWEQNLETAVRFGIPHISAYALTVEEKTPLHRLVSTGKFPPVSGEQAARQYLLMVELLKKAGYEHYEVSNFCRPGHHSRHNSAYWQGIPYLGAGPSAHSYNGISRRWNMNSISEYVNAINEEKAGYEEEVLTPVQKYNEYVMTGLRTMWGCDEGKILHRFGTACHDHFMKCAARYVTAGRMWQGTGTYGLTDEGMLFADGIASDFFLDPDSSITLL